MRSKVIDGSDLNSWRARAFKLGSLQQLRAMTGFIAAIRIEITENGVRL